MPSLADLLQIASGKPVDDPTARPSLDSILGQPSGPTTDPIMQSLQGLPQVSEVARQRGATGPYANNVRGWLNEAIAATGVPHNWLRPLMQRVDMESGGNPRAYNDTPVASGQHAQGLLQTIPSTFEAYNMNRLGHDIYDPVQNAIAAIRYILARYGDISNLPTEGGY